ncbi:DUF1853 family protein [Zunongwangia sp. H14]|uniref:DUF1853 family protein n=1 Tax=Zunongwangia sp. H14 TaxID=3240792 RepID=UPI0035647BCF
MEDKIKEQLLGFWSTPPLWKKDQFGMKQFHFPKKDKEFNGLDSVYSSHNILGKRMESFFKHLINFTPDYELIASNIQIHREKITIGEIDFLLKNPLQKKFYHVELVYKFYVYDPEIQNETERWIGPNRRDTLLQKIKRLKENQFPLLFRPETEEFLENHNLDPSEILQEVCFKAQLFLPKKLKKDTFSHINKECISGYWIKAGEFRGAPYENALFYSPKKPDWPVDPMHNKIWYSYSEIIEQVNVFLLKKRSPLIWMKTSEENYEKFFLVWW